MITRQLIFLKRVIVIAILLLLYVVEVQSQALTTKAYGIWDRAEGLTESQIPEADFVLGFEIMDEWRDIQNNGPDSYDFSLFQNTIDKALQYNRLVKVNINVGEDSPQWLYTHGVPKVIIAGRTWPYYLDPDYEKYYFKLIEAFALFLTNQPKEKFERIAFLQVKTGRTGDEAPYQGGEPPVEYAISYKDWEAFRLRAFQKHKEVFNDVADRKIVLQFNNVDEDHPEANNWLMKNMDLSIGFGIKGGAYNRGHHLNDEEVFKKNWIEYLVNPKGMKIFSSSEMDQSWQKPVFAINTELGWYWAVLSSINTGVSNTNVTASAMRYAMEHPEIQDIFRFFNKYAPQIYPASANAVVCIFHEGLNVANTVKFPESKYGSASKQNKARYLSIVNDPVYRSRGARIDDEVNMTVGQVAQRDQLTGYNDAGWEIAEGNYERFLYQINPGTTSIGLFRVRGTLNAQSSKYDRFARSFESATGKNTMYFKFDNETFSKSGPKSLKFKIVWLDKTAGSTWALKYNSLSGLKAAKEVTGIGDNEWKEVIFTITDAVVDRRGVNGSDFILLNTDDKDDIFNGIEVDIERAEKVTLVKTSELNNEINVYPNPATNKLHVNANGKELQRIQLIDLAGKLIYSCDVFNHQKSIDLSGIKGGLYIVKIFAGDHIVSKKITIEPVF